MALLKIEFGPYSSNGKLGHKIPKLHGVLSRLNELGYEVEFVPVNLINRLQVFLFDIEIFRCDIRNLLFNNNGVKNCVYGKKLIEAVEEIMERFRDDKNVPKHYMVADKRRYQSKPKNVTDYITTSDIDLLFEVNDSLLLYRKDYNGNAPATASLIVYRSVSSVPSVKKDGDSSPEVLEVAENSENTEDQSTNCSKQSSNKNDSIIPMVGSFSPSENRKSSNDTRL